MITCCYTYTSYKRLLVVLLCLCTHVSNVKMTSANVADLVICRDKDGLDCGHNPLDISRSDLEDMGYENDLEYFSDMCCSKGGGEYIDPDHPVIKKLLNATETYDSYLRQQLSIQGSPQHRALFWLLKDDTFGIQHYSEWLLQRFALSVVYFSLGGAWRWRDCWYGERYNDRYNLTLDPSTTMRESCVEYSRYSWLSGTMECNWAFINCDRNDFVTEIRMLGNVMSIEERGDYTIPYIQSTQDIVRLPEEVSFLSNRLVSLDLRGNRISGTVPSEIGSMFLLRNLNLHANELTGEIPMEVFNIQGLEELNVGKNFLNGTLPHDIGNLRQLRTLHIGYNQLSGSIPTELGLCGKLEHIYIANNDNLDGTVPEELCLLRSDAIVVLETLIADCTLECDDECCTSCTQPTSLQCSIEVEDRNNIRVYGWLMDEDVYYSDPLNDPLSVNRGCEWIELMDGCSKYGGEKSIFSYGDGNPVYPMKECCHCGACADNTNWSHLDKDCKWFEKNDLHGCPFHGFKGDSSGISAHDACCWCGGGKSYFENDPSASPSLSILPTFNPTLREGNCSDVFGWVDYDGFTCEDYPTLDEPGCPNTIDNSTVVLGEFLLYNGTEGFNGTISALQACCYCEGGYDNTMPTSTPSLSPLPSITPTVKTCQDYDGWVDKDGNSCEMFEILDSPGCPLYGSFNYSISLIFASQACCYCGGGIDDTLPTVSPSVPLPPALSNFISDRSERCSDVLIPRPWPERDCRWFALDPDGRCDQLGHTVFYEINNKNMSANEVCCACGGGTTYCADYPKWHDAHKSAYSCQQYRETEECETYGKGYVNFGMSASNACCACGGGFNIETADVILQENSEECFDEYKWISTSDNVTCSSFITEENAPDIQACLSYGHVVSVFNINGTEACCDCRYGYDDIGGGYRGDLNGRLLRVSFIEGDNVDVMHIYNSSIDAQPSGVIYEFLKEFSVAHGIGHIKIQTNESNSQFASSELACYDALTLNEVDICVGITLQNLNMPFKISSALYNDQFYLVVKKISVPFSNTLLGGFNAFTLDAWVLILVTVLLFGLTVDFIYLDWTRSCFRNTLICSSYRLSNLLYSSVTLFLGKRPVTPTANGIEKCAIFGFAIFTLFVVSTFTGSITASIVANPGNVRFASLDDAISAGAKICLSPMIETNFAVAHPGSYDLLNSTGWLNSTLLLDALDRDICDAIILSSNAFQSESRYPLSTVCDDFAILQDNVLLEVPVTIILGNLLGSVGDEIIQRLNRMIEIGWFDQIYTNREANVPLGCSENLEQDTSSSVSLFQIILPSLISIASSLIAILIRYKQLKRVEKNASKNIVEFESCVDQNKVLGLSEFELFKFLSSNKDIEQEVLAKAVDELPDKTKLLCLVQSDQSRVKVCLQSLCGSELLDIIMSSVTFPLEASIESKLRDAIVSKDRALALIDIILNSLEMTESAMRYLTEKRILVPSNSNSMKLD